MYPRREFNPVFKRRQTAPRVAFNQVTTSLKRLPERFVRVREGTWLTTDLEEQLRPDGGWGAPPPTEARADAEPELTGTF
jgi:hypothetical protein